MSIKSGALAEKNAINVKAGEKVNITDAFLKVASHQLKEMVLRSI